jgi:hypothetical protein
MQKLTIRVGAMSAFTILAAAYAGPLATDTTAMAGWHGSTTFANGLLNVVVDYAVYAPGAYGAGDPSFGSRFVYAYQGFNLSSTRPFSNISVGFQDPSVVFDGGLDATRGQLGGVSPFFQDSRSGSGFSSSSFRSIFQAVGGPYTKVLPGQWSKVLLYTSAVGPQFYSSSVIDDGTQVQLVLPSPVPAPAPLACVAVAGLMATRRRR